MTVDVYAWPPVSEVAFRISRVDPISTSTSLIDGQPRESRFGRSRRVATQVVDGIGIDAASAGYIETLKYYLRKDGVNLIRMETYGSIWHHARAQLNPSLAQSQLLWTTDGTELTWTTGGVDLNWSATNIFGTPTTSGGWPAITVSGLPPSQIVARPDEVISVISGETKETTRTTTVARSNGSGVATIRLREAFTIDGPVIIGDTESIVFRPLALPEAIQPQSGGWQYEWELVEAFEDEYSGGFVEKNPW